MIEGKPLDLWKTISMLTHTIPFCSNPKMSIRGTKQCHTDSNKVSTFDEKYETATKTNEEVLGLCCSVAFTHSVYSTIFHSITKGRLDLESV